VLKIKLYISPITALLCSKRQQRERGTTTTQFEQYVPQNDNNRGGNHSTTAGLKDIIIYMHGVMGSGGYGQIDKDLN